MATPIPSIGKRVAQRIRASGEGVRAALAGLGRFSRRQIAVWLAACIAAGLLLAVLSPFPGPAIATQHTLEITATGKQNDLAKGSEVWLVDIRSSRTLRPEDIRQVCKGNWEARENALVSLQNQPSRLKCSLTAGHQVSIHFATHEWSGIARLEFDRQEAITQDLYSPAGGSQEIVFRIPPGKGQKLASALFILAAGACLGLLLFALSAFLITDMLQTWPRPFPRLRSTRRAAWIEWLRGAAATRSGTFLLWLAVLSAGGVILTGRYDWDAEPLLSRTAYFCSAYYFLIVTPVIYYLVYTLSGRRGAAAAITAAWWVVATLPYAWLGLDRFYYPLEALGYTDKMISPKNYDWFPQAFHSFHAIPNEAAIFAGLALLGAGLAFFCYRRYPQSRRMTLLGLLAYAAILLQTWMHLSLRSPYLYYTSYFGKEESWYIRYMFSGKMGGVNADLNAFRVLELLFMGKPHDQIMLFRRSFYFYLSSQFSYFVNLYYVGLLFNIALWTAATFCGYAFTRKYWPERVALLTAGFIATGPGFIMFVAQPMSYLAQYAIIIITVYLFERLVVEGRSHAGKMVLFAATLGLAAMVYDLFPFYLFIAGYGLLQKVNWKALLGIFSLSLVIYAGLILLFTRGLGGDIPATNSQYASGAVSGLIELARSGNFRQWYAISLNYFGQFFLNMGSAFFILPVVFALLGLPFIKERKQAFILLFFFLPALALQAVLQYGNSWIYLLPRLYYIVYPGVYILAAVFLDRLGQAFTSTSPRISWLASLLPWLGLAAVILLNNVDVWGFPVAYYHFYQSGGSPERLVK
jgi:hypothetical protein